MISRTFASAFMALLVFSACSRDYPDNQVPRSHHCAPSSRAFGLPTRPAVDLVYIPGGLFKGCMLEPFYMARTETTSAAYMECVRTDHCAPPSEGDWCNGDRPTHPINCITYSDAVAFCAWQGERLPTVQEWAWAAQGRQNRNPYPWGSREPSCELGIMPLTVDGDTSGCGENMTWPVGSRPVGASRD